MKKVSDKLRGKVEQMDGDPVDTGFVTLLMVVSAVNTFNVFSKSFGALGLLIVIPAIIMFDGGWAYWERKYNKFASNDQQEKYAKRARDITAWMAVAMFFTDIAMHSGQLFIPLEFEIVLMGMSALVGQVFGMIAMMLVVGAFGSHVFHYFKFREYDMERKNELEQRRAVNDERARELAMGEASNKLKSVIAADVVDRLENDYREIGEAAAGKIVEQLLPEIVSSFAKTIVGNRLPDVIDAEAHDPKTAPRVQTATAKAAEVDAEPLNPIRPAKGRGKA